MAPRAVLEAALAQSALSLVSRSGPTVPVALAAASVWQPLHPAVPTNTAFPAATLAAEAEDELDAPDAPLAEDEDEDELADPEAPLLEAPEAPLLEDEDGPPGDGVPYPGTALLTLGGVTPTGGGALAGWERSQLANCVGLTTRTLVRISEWPAPQSSVHSTG